MTPVRSEPQNGEPEMCVECIRPIAETDGVEHGGNSFGMMNLPGLTWCGIYCYVEFRDKHFGKAGCGNSHCPCADPGNWTLCDDFCPTRRDSCARCGWDEYTHSISQSLERVS